MKRQSMQRQPKPVLILIILIGFLLMTSMAIGCATGPEEPAAQPIRNSEIPPGPGGSPGQKGGDVASGSDLGAFETMPLTGHYVTGGSSPGLQQPERPNLRGTIVVAPEEPIPAQQREQQGTSSAGSAGAPFSTPTPSPTPSGTRNQ